MLLLVIDKDFRDPRLGNILKFFGCQLFPTDFVSFIKSNLDSLCGWEGADFLGPPPTHELRGGAVAS